LAKKKKTLFGEYFYKKKIITIDLKKFKLKTLLNQLIHNKIFHIKFNLNNKKKLKPLIRIPIKKKKLKRSN
jgi:hypothetical protein